MSTVTTAATTYSVSTLPMDDPMWTVRRILVSQHTDGTWSLSRLGAYLMRSGQWEHRPAGVPWAEQDRHGQQRVRLDSLEEALALAEKEATR